MKKKSNLTKSMIKYAELGLKPAFPEIIARNAQLALIKRFKRQARKCCTISGWLVANHVLDYLTTQEKKIKGEK